MNPKFLWAGILLGIEFFVKPSFSLLSVVLILIALDLVTGVVKAKFQHKERTSEGYRRTVIKLLQYLGPVIVLYIGSKSIPEHSKLLKDISGYVMMFICYIEATSIFENLYEIDKKSMIAKFLYRPALVILKFGMEKNPVTQAADKIDAQNKSETKP
jgi:phage-related holin